MHDLDSIIRSASEEFVSEVFASGWRGREREAISLFAFGFLQRHCAVGTVLSDPTQIAIEAAVRGVPRLNPKGRVNKDLVIWPKPGMSLWGEDWRVANEPIAVLEWKVFRKTTRTPSLSAYDLDWLTEYSREHPRFVGHAVWLDLAERGRRFTAARVRAGQVDADWLVL